MKTNALLATCAALLGALLMLVGAMAFGLATPAQAQDKGDESSNVTASDGDYTALAVAAGSNSEVLVILRKVASEHPYLKKDFPDALSMGVYAFQMNGQKSGSIHLIGTRYVDQDLVFPEWGDAKAGTPIDEVNKNLAKYREAVKKIK